MSPTGPPKISLQKVNRSPNKTKSASVNNINVKNRINGSKMLSCVHYLYIFPDVMYVVE